MIALEEAGIQLRIAGTVRDKVVSAYQDLTRMQI
jgi:flagellar hook-basal body complex protein FliE